MKTNVKSAFAAIIIAALSLPGAALAQAGDQVQLSGDVMLVQSSVDAEGREVTELVEPATIVPGDRLVFGTDYANAGDEAMTNFVVTNPVPAAVRLAPDANSDLVVSVDGGEEYGTLSTLNVVLDDGTQRAANHADVTHIRWTIASIAPGESGRVEYPAVIR